MKELTLYLDDTKFTKKPTTEDIKKISKHILKKKVTLSLKEFAEEIAEKGRTAVLAEFMNGVALTKRSVILGQEVIMLDFDNKDKENVYSLEDLNKDTFIQKYASFYYKTFNDSEDCDRFRVVFILDSKFTKYTQVDEFYSQLFEKYPQSDSAIGQTNRLFFGSNSGYVEINFDNQLPKDYFQHGLVSSSENILITEDTPNYLLFKYKQFELLKERYGNTYTASFPDESVASSYFRTIDMVDFLGLPLENPFIDIFRDENNPSASVFLTEDTNVYLYKVFSEGSPQTMDLLKVVSKLTGFGLLPTIDILVQVTNSVIDLNSDIAKSKRQANVFIDFITRKEFKETEPTLYNWIGRYIPEITTLLQVITAYMWQDYRTGEARMISFLSTESLASEVSTRLGYNVSPKKMRNVVNVLATIDGVWKLPDQEIPTNLLRDLEKSKKIQENERRVNVLEVKEYPEDFITSMNNIAEELAKNKVTVRGLSFELLYRLFNEDKANQVFPQIYKPKGVYEIPKKSQTLESKIVRYMMSEIDEHGYVFESDIISMLNKKMSKTKADYKMKQLRADISNKYNLTRCRLNKELKVKFNIDNSVVSKVIYY